MTLHDDPTMTECPRNHHTGEHEVRPDTLKDSTVHDGKHRRPTKAGDLTREPCLWCGTIITLNWV